MNQEIVSYSGWSRNLLLSNAHAELIITLEVGPRVISYRHASGRNVFKNFQAEMGCSGEEGFVLRGGHRLWVAPEDEVLSYHFDNHPVDYRVDDSSGEVVIDAVQARSGRITKSMAVSLAKDGPEVTVRHTIRNDGQEPIQAAAWALSVMEAGGVEIIPQPPLGEHPRDLLPNRGIVLWPYTDLTDPRWTLGRTFFTLRQSEGFPPTKIGLAHRERWIAYVIEDSLFIKTFDHVTGAVYPDGGCNFETFSNSDMLEIESLSPLASLEPGQSVSHTERWYVFPITGEAQINSEDSLANWLEPFLAKAGIS